MKKGHPEAAEKGTFWQARRIKLGTRRWVACGVGKSETEAAIEGFQTLKRRGHPDAPLLTVSEGWGGIGEAMVEVYGKVPAYTGGGRTPTRERPERRWQYPQVV